MTREKAAILSEEDEEERRRKRKKESIKLESKIKKSTLSKSDTFSQMIKTLPINQCFRQEILPILDTPTFYKKIITKKFVLPKLSYNFHLDIHGVIDIKYKKIYLHKKYSLPKIFPKKTVLLRLLPSLLYRRKLVSKKYFLPLLERKTDIEILPELSQLDYTRIITDLEEHIENVERKCNTYTSEEFGGGGRPDYNIFDILFINNWGYKGGVKASKEPYIIFLIDRNQYSSKEILKSLLQRIIEEMEDNFSGFKEESVGKLPNSTKEKRKEEREKEIERYLEILKKVFIINLKSSKDLETFDTISITDRLNELKGRYTGFLVFYLKLDEMSSLPNEVRKIKKWIENICRGNISYQPNFLIITLNEFNLNVVGKLVGFRYETIKNIFLKKRDEYLQFGNNLQEPDSIFELGRKLQLEKREKIKRKISQIVERNREEFESELHYDIKCLVVYYLWKNIFPKIGEERLHEITNRIKTEFKKDGIIPDVCICKEDKEEVWEIETLLSEGTKAGDPTKKIDESIEKYGDRKDIQINIVLDNISYFLHISEIKKKLRWWKNILKDKIDFWIPDWENETLERIG